MTPAEFTAARHTLNLTFAEMADRLGVDIRTAQRWEAGDRKIPGPVVKLLAIYLEERAARLSDRGEPDKGEGGGK